MCTSRRGLARILVASAIFAAGMAICAPATAQNKGGNKPSPPPNIPRPICFWAYQPKGNRSVLQRADASGTSIITVNSGVYMGAWPRWSPDGSLIGGYHKVVDRDTALMVMDRDATGEHVVMTAGQFNVWNLARPGVLGSKYRYGSLYSVNCWLGNNAFVFAGETTYDATYFGGLPGETITAMRLFIVDAMGTITPLTESAALGTTLNDSNPHWSAALNKIVFVGANELFAINPDGSDLQQVTRFGISWDPQHATWSPAGDRIAVCVGSLYREVRILDVDLSQPLPGTGEGGRVTAVLSLKNSNDAQRRNASWSPDGRFLVYNHAQTSAGSYPLGDYIMIADVETGTESIVSGSESGSSGPDWDPLDLGP